MSMYCYLRYIPVVWQNKTVLLQNFLEKIDKHQTNNGFVADNPLTIIDFIIGVSSTIERLYLHIPIRNRLMYIQ